MKEKASGLAMKLITGVLLLSVLLCAAISYMGYREFTTVLEDEYNRSAYEIAETAKTYLDADRLEYYLETGEIDEAYLEIQARLDALVRSTDSYIIYVTRLSNDYTTSTYIFDSVHPDTGFTRYELGYCPPLVYLEAVRLPRRSRFRSVSACAGGHRQAGGFRSPSG